MANFRRAELLAHYQNRPQTSTPADVDAGAAATTPDNVSSDASVNDAEASTNTQPIDDAQSRPQ
jgi:hypothetical protein